MTTLSFKAQDDLNGKLQLLAKKLGINLSATIKLLLTKSVNQELSKITENNMTTAEELEILQIDKSDKTEGPFKNTNDLMKALQS